MGIRVKSDENYYYWFVGAMPAEKFGTWFANHPGFDNAEIGTYNGAMVVKLAKKYVTAVTKKS